MERDILDSLAVAIHRLIYFSIPKESLYVYLPYVVHHTVDGRLDRVRLLDPSEHLGVDWPASFKSDNESRIRRFIENGRGNESELGRVVEQIQTTPKSSGIYIHEQWRGGKSYRSVAQPGADNEDEYYHAGDLYPVAIYAVQRDGRVVLIASVDYSRGVEDDYRWNQALYTLDKVLSTLDVWGMVDPEASNLWWLLKGDKPEPIFQLDDYHSYSRFLSHGDPAVLVESIKPRLPEVTKERSLLLEKLGERDATAFNIVKAIYDWGFRPNAATYHALGLFGAMWLTSGERVAAECSLLKDSGGTAEPCALNWEFLKRVNCVTSEPQSKDLLPQRANNFAPVRFYGHCAGLARHLIRGNPERWQDTEGEWMTLERVSLSIGEECMDVTFRGRGGLQASDNPLELFSSSHQDTGFKTHIQSLVRICNATRVGALPYAVESSYRENISDHHATTVFCVDREVTVPLRGSAVTPGHVDLDTLLPADELRYIPNNKRFSLRFRLWLKCVSG